LTQKLVREGLVEGIPDPGDRRCRRLHLTARARTLMRQARPVWRAIGQTLATRCGAEDVDILAALSGFERVLDGGIIEQVIALCEHFDRSALRIVPFSHALREHFYRLNEAWLRRYFYVEEIDHEVLSDPEGRILADGGSIWFALIGDEVVGTCALKPAGASALELTKMAVDDGYQGLGIGRALIDVVIEHFRQSDAGTLFLETNSKLVPAIALYQSVGFERQPGGKPDSRYARSDVYMIWRAPAGDATAA
jgi:ribosomal protein S18 acetylase RimI-like enzyme